MSNHVPVLLKEVIAQFDPQPGDILIDATLGLGGHAEAYLAAAADTRVIGFDADDAALTVARARLAKYGDRVQYVHSNFASLKTTLPTDVSPTHILFDLGIGSHQLADEQRGFSFTSDAPLQMKYGEAQVLPPSQIEAINRLERRLDVYPDAAEVIRFLSAEELAEVIHTYGEERYARRIGQALASADPKPTTAKELAEILRQAVPANYERGRIHPATRTFQALRLAVNRELEVLQAALPQAVDLLVPAGKLAVISFHSLEDRIVKHFLRDQARDCICPPEQPICTCNKTARVVLETRKPIVASAEEIALNPRARSAKLRVARKADSS